MGMSTLKVHLSQERLLRKDGGRNKSGTLGNSMMNKNGKMQLGLLQRILGMEVKAVIHKKKSNLT
eukprot:3754540-Karenia_brevis.AAC.1